MAETTAIAPAIPFALVPTLSAATIERLRAAIAGRMAPATRRALLGDGRTFVCWCAQANQVALPASPATVQAFLAAACAAGRKASTLRRYRSSLVWWHAAAGFANPCAAPGTGTAVAAAPIPPDEAILGRLDAYLALAQRAMAPATLRALRADARVFAAWCAARSLPWLPAAPETVQAFVDDLGASRRPATVARYLGSIATLHRAAGAANPCDHWRVQLARKAHRQEQGARQRQARPLGDAELVAILDRLPADGAAPLRALRDRALLLVGRDTLARADELVTLRWADLEPVDPDDPAAGPGEGTILIRRSKTDQAGEGAMAWLSAEAMAALAAWRAAIEAAVDPATGATAGAGTFLFRSLARRGFGERMSTAAVRRVVAERAANADPLAAGFTGHSLRVGAAQDLLAAGVDLAGLMQAGRWKSPQMPARYTERLRATRGAVAQVRRARGAADT
ncbi:tyrosine-type recombinase/integrase [Azospirillum brasilense]|uniref:tyrosine-type recombinase/integrase n=1 Tax=Azospirillum brasilense TaxID=192 RepID=UPI0019638F99|nr:tyrosine-type recombinase/integrase [Azospirillum brasilense]